MSNPAAKRTDIGLSTKTTTHSIDELGLMTIRKKPKKTPGLHRFWQEEVPELSRDKSLPHADEDTPEPLAAEPNGSSQSPLAGEAGVVEGNEGDRLATDRERARQ